MVLVRTKEWGNSLGVIIPAELVRERKLRPGQEVDIIIRPRTPLQQAFGSLKFDKPTDELLREYRKENLYSKWSE